MTQLEQKIKTLKDNPRIFIEKFLKIEVLFSDTISPQYIRHRGNLYSFVLNPEQQTLLSFYENDLKKRKPSRFIILKSRQIGISTLITALGFHHVRFTSNATNYVVAHSDASSRRLFNITKIYLSELPRELKPLTKYSTKRELVFENPNPKDTDNPGLRSKIILGVPNKDVGASFTISFFHASEVSRWNSAEEVMASIAPASLSATFIIESTAQFSNDYFHTQWLLSKDQAQKGYETGFTPIFFPWYVHPTYTKTLTQEWFDIPLNSDNTYGDEIELKKLYCLSDEQLFWRRWCILNVCQSNLDIFKREYPSNDVEPFLYRATAYFNITKLQQKLKLAKDGVKGDIKENTFIQSSEGLWTIWEKPVKGITYIAGVDTATGLETGDYSVCEIFRADTLSQVAELRVKYPPTRFAKLVLNGIQFYNDAFTNIEITGPGIAVLEAIKDVYFNLYFWQRFDEFGNPCSIRKLGFETNSRTKELLLSDIADYIEEDWGNIYSVTLLQELMNYVQFPDGKIGVPSNCYDDTIMAFGLVLRAYQSHQRTWNTKPTATTLSSSVASASFATQLGDKLYIPFQEYSPNREEYFTPWGVL